MRPAIRSLGLFCLAFALPVGAQEVKQWTSELLTKEMNEVDRRLRSLEKASKPTDRRLIELEGQVRALRLKADMIEIQLKSLDSNVQALRKEIAALGGRGEAVEPRPTPARHPEKGTPVPAGLATIRSQKVSENAEALTITGVVANTSDKPLVFVIVQADLLDKEGKVVRTESAYTEPRVVPAGSTATFVIKAARDPRVQDHRLSLRTE